MLYVAYQAHSDFMVPVRTFADLAIRAMASAQPIGVTAFTRNLSAAYELIARAGLSHDRPAFAIDSVMVGNEEVAVHEEAAHVTPFGTLLHFKKDIATAQPARAAGGAAVGTLRDAVALHRAHAPRRSRTSSLPTGTMSATCRGRRGGSASTNTSSTSSNFSRRSGRAPTWSRCASPVSLSWSPPP